MQEALREKPVTAEFRENMGNYIQPAVSQISLHFGKLAQVLQENRVSPMEVERCKRQAIDAYMAAVSEVLKYVRID